MKGAKHFYCCKRFPSFIDFVLQGIEHLNTRKNEHQMKTFLINFKESWRRNYYDNIASTSPHDDDDQILRVFLFNLICFDTKIILNNNQMTITKQNPWKWWKTETAKCKVKFSSLNSQIVPSINLHLNRNSWRKKATRRCDSDDDT